MDEAIERQVRALSGLRYGHAYISASERIIADMLHLRGLVKIWTCSSGFDAWCLTPEGRTYINTELARPRESMS